jgi:predicted ATP-binding protein involved in virulence
MMIGLVGDIAHRCTRLNPHFGADAAQLTPGVVMIDEVDMHLHPEWQQLVLKGLTDAFPRIQFIVTTHSPQVLTTVKRENIRILAQNADGLWSTDMPDEETKGDESATLLASVMGVDPVPQVPEAADLNRYRHLIQLQQQDSDEGKTLKIKLDTHFGPRHHLMLDCDRMIRLAQFKAKLPIPASQS